MIRPRLTATAMACLVIAGVSGGDEIAGFTEIRKAAVPKQRPTPHYPRSELARNQHGWVDLSYVVTSDGTVVDPIVINSSGSNAFEREAKRAALKFVYEPATINGEPVQQCQTRVRITFATDGKPGGVSRRFRSRYKQVATLLDDGALDDANAKIAELFETKRLSLAENSWLWALRARAAALQRDDATQLRALRKATAISKDWIDPQLYPNLLTAKMALEIKSARFADALDSFAALRETGRQDANIDALSKAAARINDVVNSDQLLAVPARIEARIGCDDCTPNWQYKPLRRQFRFDQVQGTLGEFELRCEWQRYRGAANADQDWSMPEAWGDCSIVVFGEPGTEFRLLELPTA